MNFPSALLLIRASVSVVFCLSFRTIGKEIGTLKDSSFTLPISTECKIKIEETNVDPVPLIEIPLHHQGPIVMYMYKIDQIYFSPKAI